MDRFIFTTHSQNKSMAAKCKFNSQHLGPKCPNVSNQWCGINNLSWMWNIVLHIDGTRGLQQTDVNHIQVFFLRLNKNVNVLAILHSTWPKYPPATSKTATIQVNLKIIKPAPGSRSQPASLLLRKRLLLRIPSSSCNTHVCMYTSTEAAQLRRPSLEITWSSYICRQCN